MKHLKKLLVLPFLLLSLNAFSTPDNFSKYKVEFFDGGLNSYDLADVITDNQGTELKNVVLNRKGRLSKRLGQSQFANDVGNTAFTGSGTYKLDSTNSFIVAASGGDVILSNTTEDNWTVINSGNSLTKGKDTEFIQARDLLFVLNGADNTPLYNKSLEKWEGGGTYPSSPPTATVGTWVRNYLFLAGRPDYESFVYFSNNLVPATFDAGDLIRINAGDGQDIVWIEAFRLNEVIIYRDNSIYDLDISGDTPLSDWTVQPITRNIGCVAGRTVANIGNDHWFLSNEPIAVRSLVRSSFDKLLIDYKSTPIQDIFDGTGDLTINRTRIDQACAVYFDDKYILAIPTGSSTVNNTVCVYSFITDGWYIIDGWFPSSWVVYEKDLYYTDANDGRMIKCFDGTVGDIAEGPGLASTPTVAISYEWASKNIDFGNDENYKRLDALEVEFSTSGDYTAEIFIELDDNGFNSIGTINLSGNVITLPVNLPFTLTSGGTARKMFQLTAYDEFRNIKVKVVQNGLSEVCELNSIIIFARIKPWRREN